MVSRALAAAGEAYIAMGNEVRRCWLSRGRHRVNPCCPRFVSAMKLKCGETLSNSAFNLNLRRYSEAAEELADEIQLCGELARMFG